MPDLTMQPQLETEWCWAAVAVSVHQFLDPASPIAWTQAALATKVVTLENPLMAGIDCSQTPDACNLPAKLDDALRIIGNLAAQGVLENEFLTFDNLTQFIDQAPPLPVCARIVWNSGGAHFIALDGYRVFSSGVQQVHVQDPLYGPSYQFFNANVGMDYSTSAGMGIWQDTYLVKQ